MKIYAWLISRDKDEAKLVKREYTVFFNVMTLQDVLYVFICNFLPSFSKSFLDICWGYVPTIISIEIFK